MSGTFDGNTGDGGGPGYSGSRVEAIEEGLLMDISQVGTRIGFRWHVAITRDAWNQTVKWNRLDSKRAVYLAQRRRLIDMLRVCARKIRDTSPESSRMAFSVKRIPFDGSSDIPVRVELEMVAHLGDEGEPVLTITLSPANDA